MASYKVGGDKDWLDHKPGSIVTDPQISDEDLAVVLKLGVLIPTTTQATKKDEE